MRQTVVHIFSLVQAILTLSSIIIYSEETGTTLVPFVNDIKTAIFGIYNFFNSKSEVNH